MPDCQLSPNFCMSEFRCKCCGQVNEDNASRLAARLQEVRNEYGVMRIVSSFRCVKQNDLVKGKHWSQHLIGLAADIAVDSDTRRRQLVLLLLQFGFPRLGVAGTFIHADIGTITGPLLWVY